MDGVGGSGSGVCPFLRRTSSKRTFATMVDSPRNASPDTLFVQQDNHYDNDHISQRHRPNGLALPPLPSRAPLHFAGDGLDLRRPIMSSGGSSAVVNNRSAVEVVDLTEEDDAQHSRTDLARDATPPAITAASSRAQRGPRFGRDIIDVESEGEEEEPHARTSAGPTFQDLYTAAARRPHSPPHLHHPQYSNLRRPYLSSAGPTTNMDDLEILEERPLPSWQANRSRTPAQAPRSITPYPGGGNETIDLTGDDDDDVLHVDTRPRPGGINHDRPLFTGGVGTRAVDAIAQLFNNGASRLRDRYFMGQAVEVTRRAHEDRTHVRHRNTGTNNGQHRDDGMPRVILARQAIVGPGMMLHMDYDAPAFDMGYGGNTPAAPPYEPPPDAASGFTRSPGEDEVVVCPNCGEELAMGETDEEQEVWVIKKCGHAYCGKCAKNHTKAPKGSKKGKGKAVSTTDGVPNFNKCVVDGCKENATAKSFVHVFVGG